MRPQAAITAVRSPTRASPIRNAPDIATSTTAERLPRMRRRSTIAHLFGCMILRACRGIRVSSQLDLACTPRNDLTLSLAGFLPAQADRSVIMVYSPHTAPPIAVPRLNRGKKQKSPGVRAMCTVKIVSGAAAASAAGSPPIAHGSAAEDLGDARARCRGGVIGQLVQSKVAVGHDLAGWLGHRRLAKVAHHEQSDMIAAR
jgi:hypothetical protein